MPKSAGNTGENAVADYEFCKVEREGRLTIVTLNRPEVMNAVHPPQHFELDAIFNDFANDPDQWVGIVTGAGERARFDEANGLWQRDVFRSLRGRFGG